MFCVRDALALAHKISGAFLLHWQTRGILWGPIDLPAFFSVSLSFRCYCSFIYSRWLFFCYSYILVFAFTLSFSCDAIVVFLCVWSALIACKLIWDSSQHVFACFAVNNNNNDDDNDVSVPPKTWFIVFKIDCTKCGWLHLFVWLSIRAHNLSVRFWLKTLTITNPEHFIYKINGKFYSLPEKTKR